MPSNTPGVDTGTIVYNYVSKEREMPGIEGSVAARFKTARKCLIPNCKRGEGYQTGKSMDAKCPNFCGAVSNSINAGGVTVNSVKQQVFCGRNGDTSFVPCENGSLSGKICKCQDGWTGRACDKEVVPPISTGPPKCVHGELKVLGYGNRASCVCDSTYGGAACDKPRCDLGDAPAAGYWGCLNYRDMDIDNSCKLECYTNKGYGLTSANTQTCNRRKTVDNKEFGQVSGGTGRCTQVAPTGWVESPKFMIILVPMSSTPTTKIRLESLGLEVHPIPVPVFASDGGPLLEGATFETRVDGDQLTVERTDKGKAGGWTTQLQFFARAAPAGRPEPVVQHGRPKHKGGSTTALLLMIIVIIGLVLITVANRKHGSATN